MNNGKDQGITVISKESIGSLGQESSLWTKPITIKGRGRYFTTEFNEGYHTKDF